MAWGTACNDAGRFAFSVHSLRSSHSFVFFAALESLSRSGFLRNLLGIQFYRLLIAGIGVALCSVGIIFFSFSGPRQEYFVPSVRIDRMAEQSNDPSDASAVTEDSESEENLINMRGERLEFKEACAAAVEALKVSDYETAIDLLSDAIEISPHSPVGWSMRAGVYSQLGRDRAALNDYNLALDYDPDYLDAIIGRAMLWFDHRRVEMALIEFDRAAALAPDRSDIYSNRAYIYLALGKSEPAIIDLDRAIRLGDSRPQTIYRRAKLHIAARRYERALGDLDKAIEKMPGRGEPIFQRGLVKLRTGKIDSAIEDFDQAIELGPNCAPYYAARAEAYRSQGNKQQAQADRTKAQELARENWGEN